MHGSILRFPFLNPLPQGSRTCVYLVRCFCIFIAALVRQRKRDYLAPRIENQPGSKMVS